MQGSEEEEEEAGTEPVPKLWLSGEGRSRAGSSAAAPPRPGLPESTRSQPRGWHAGCWGRNPKCGRGLGGSPHTGRFCGAALARLDAKERFCKRAQPASTKGGDRAPSRTTSKGSSRSRVFYFWGKRGEPRGARRGSQGLFPRRTRLEHNTSGRDLPVRPPPSLQGHPCLCQTPSAAAEASSRARGGGGGCGGAEHPLPAPAPAQGTDTARGPPPPAGRRRFPAGWGCLSGAALSAGTAPGRAGGMWAAAYLQRHRRGM